MKVAPIVVAAAAVGCQILYPLVRDRPETW